MGIFAPALTEGLSSKVTGRRFGHFYRLCARLQW